MGRGIISGLGVGGLISAFVLALVSLMTVPPVPPQTVLPQVLPQDIPAPLPQPDPTPEVLPDMTPVAGPVAKTTPTPTPTPGVTPGIIEVPAGSEFARAADDAAPARPAADEAAPQTTIAPDAPASDTEPAPALADTAPPARPQPVAPGPVLPLMPNSVPATVPDLPGAEAPVPVPPPGEVDTPVLAPVEAAEGGTEPGGMPARAEPGASNATAALAPSLPPLGMMSPELGDGDLPAPVPAEGQMPAPDRIIPDAAPPKAGLSIPDMPEIEAPEMETATTDRPDGDAFEVDITGPGAAESDADAPPAAGAVDPDLPPVFSTQEPARPFGAAGARPGFVNAPGVRVNRLPNLDSPTAVPMTAPVAPAAAIEAFAQPFSAAIDAPLLAIVLIDPGTAAGGLDRNTLKAISFPVTIALDPMRPDAALAAADFRAAGFEVAILATDMPNGAAPQDVEVSVEAWRAEIPEAVAVVEPESGLFQQSRMFAEQLVGILKREGLGLLAQSGGLNPGWQQAQKAGLPRAKVWRVLDAGREMAPAIKHRLDRARFEAARGQSVVVMLHGWPESVAGLLSWQAENAEGVVLAPVSAVALRAE
ncbi:divergent polysaccharide deacetylase family protein [Phaeovulum sp.]|uniref:divergent polysaccharide deacetylase family protein n=1 Tax=Phaeovulum sp. TaxID=2934796 RepID=UPI0039E5A01A